MLEAQFFTDTGQHEIRMKMRVVFFIIKLINNFKLSVMVWAAIKQEKLQVNLLQID